MNGKLCRFHIRCQRKLRHSIIDQKIKSETQKSQPTPRGVYTPDGVFSWQNRTGQVVAHDGVVGIAATEE